MKNQLWPIVIVTSLVFVTSILAARIFLQRRVRKANLSYLNALAPKQEKAPVNELKETSMRFRQIERFKDSAYGEWFKDVAAKSGLWDEAEYLKVIGRKGELSLAVFIVAAFFTGLNTVSDFLLTLLLAFFAFVLPDLWIYNRSVKRAKEIEAAIPETIELLNMCIRAGLGFQAGMMRIAQTRNNPLSEEFNRVLSEIRLGASRADAFLALSDRLQIDTLKQFVNSILQADRSGIPIAKVLDDLAVKMRNIQRDNAREQAQKVPVKILAPIMIFLLPALLMIVLGPAAITIMKVFK